LSEKNTGEQLDENVEMSHPRNKFTLISRSGVAKDKKSLEKDSRNCQKRIDLFLDEVVGVSSPEKGLPVIASDLPFRCLRNLGTILNDCCSLSHDANLSHLAEELRNFLEANASFRRPLKSILEKMKSEESNSGTLALHVYLYSTTDDRFDMISYIPSILSKIMDNNLPQIARQTSPGNAPTSSKGKLSKKGGAS
jgi:hypothetical protein